MSTETETAKTTNIAIVPTPGMGHLIPLLELAKGLIAKQENVWVSFIVPTDGPLSMAQKAVLDSLPPNITSVLLPPVSLDDDVQVEGARAETIISLTMLRSLPALRQLFKSMVDDNNKRVSALVVDLFGTDAFDVAREFNISPYIFFTSTATTLSFLLHLPKLDETVSCQYRELEDPIQAPGWNISVHGKDLLDPVQDRTNIGYKWMLHHSNRYKLAQGVMVNSFKELEPGPLSYLEKPGEHPPVYPVGPIVNMGRGLNSECLSWLDQQPEGSVLYVSFGSGGTLSSAQLIELAFGLENSEQRFLWVIRSPNDEVTDANFFDALSQKDPFDFLPKGFLERTQGKGLVVPSWAPQVEILSHGSTSGFLTHCGWNSILESVVNGVPLIAWPLYAEQKMNAVLLTEDIKVGLRPKVNANGLVVRDEIENVVRILMEGEEGKGIRDRMRALKEAAFKVLGENGSSTKALSELVNKWKAQV